MKQAKSPFFVLALAAATFALVAVYVFSFAYQRGETFAEGSSHRATKDGMRALALLLEKRGHPIARLQDAWTLKKTRGVLFSISSHHDKNVKGG
jgi:hypothetical protein